MTPAGIVELHSYDIADSVCAVLNTVWNNAHTEGTHARPSIAKNLMWYLLQCRLLSERPFFAFLRVFLTKLPLYSLMLKMPKAPKTFRRELSPVLRAQICGMREAGMSFGKIWAKTLIPISTIKTIWASEGAVKGDFKSATRTSNSDWTTTQNHQR